MGARWGDQKVRGKGVVRDEHECWKSGYQRHGNVPWRGEIGHFDWCWCQRTTDWTRRKLSMALKEKFPRVVCQTTQRHG